MLLAAANEGSYNLVKTLHIVLAVVAFGGAVLSQLQVRKALALGREGKPILDAQAALRPIMAAASGLVFLLGFALIMMSGKVQNAATGEEELLYGFAKPWVNAAMTLWLILTALTFALAKPAATKLADALGAGDTQGARAHLGKLTIADAVTNVLWVVIIALMVFKPGQ